MDAAALRQAWLGLRDTHRLLPDAGGGWFNVLDPDFNLQLREAGVAAAWRVVSRPRMAPSPPSSCSTEPARPSRCCSARASRATTTIEAVYGIGFRKLPGGGVLPRLDPGP